MGRSSKKIRSYFDMNVLDLSPVNKVAGANEYIYDNITVDYPTAKGINMSGLYLGHPDSALLDNGDILVAYPLGHGKGETVIKRSTDGGLTWGERMAGLPDTFKDTMETPTIYKLDFLNGTQKLVMISGRPGWGRSGNANGYDVTVSVSKGSDGRCDGAEWLAHENFYGDRAKQQEFYAPKGKWDPIVAMASLTRLKDSAGKFMDKWMGIFHQGGRGKPFNIFKTFLTFNEAGDMQWSYPANVFICKSAKKIERKYNFCEPEVVRAPDGKELAMIFRANAKKSFSYASFSVDEGATWSNPQTLSREITGERHKAEYDPITGKLIVTSRNIDWVTDKDRKRSGWISRGWLAWVGDYADLHKGADGKGDVVLKLTHTYIGSSEIGCEAHADTGYAGLTIDAKGNAVIMSYGKFTAGRDDTYIVAKRFNVAEIVKLGKK